MLIDCGSECSMKELFYLGLAFALRRAVVERVSIVVGEQDLFGRGKSRMNSMSLESEKFLE